MSEEAKSDRAKFDADRSLSDLREECNCPIAFYGWISLKYPNLSKFAIKLFLIPASTALLEGMFSSWSFIHSPVRNRLSAQTSQALLDVYYYLNYDNYKAKRCVRKFVEVDDPNFVLPLTATHLNVDEDDEGSEDEAGFEDGGDENEHLDPQEANGADLDDIPEILLRDRMEVP